MRCLLLLLSLPFLHARGAAALEPEQWKEDLVALRQAVAAHPNPFHKVKREEFDRRAEQIEANFTDRPDFEVVAQLAELLAMLGDGHTRLTLPMVEGADFFLGHAKTAPPKIMPFGHFPIRLSRAADGFVVTRAAEEHRDLLGAIVRSIEGKPIAEVETAVLPLVHGDNEFQRRHLLSTFLVVPELLAATKVVPQPDQSRWEFRLADEQMAERRLSRLSGPAKWVRLDKAAARVSEERHWYEKRPGNLIYARLTDVMDEPQESVASFCQKLFAEVDRTPEASLVLDLRGNPGGDNTLNDAIVRGAIRSRRLWEPGRFFVLIDPGTFSAAANLTVLLERWTPATFVGQPTGGAPNGYGDSKRTVLPHSGLTARVSSLYWQMSSPNDRRDASLPHLVVQPTARSLRESRDAELELVSLLAGRPGPADGIFHGQLALPGKSLPLHLQIESERILASIPDLKVEGQVLEQVKRSGGTWEGKGKVGDRHFEVHGRLTGRRLLGWIELSGRPFVFTAESP